MTLTCEGWGRLSIFEGSLLHFMLYRSSFKTVRLNAKRERPGENPGAEGATAPETLRQKDRRVLNSGE